MRGRGREEGGREDVVGSGGVEEAQETEQHARKPKDVVAVHVRNKDALDLAWVEEGVDELALGALSAVKEHLLGPHPHANARATAADRGHLGRRAQDLNVKPCQELGVLHDDPTVCHGGGVEGGIVEGGIGGGGGGGGGERGWASPSSETTAGPSRPQESDGVHPRRLGVPVGCVEGVV